MTGSKPVALPLGYAPSLYCDGRAVLRSRTRRLPVVDREFELQVGVRELDAAWHQHLVSRRGDRRKSVGGIGDPPQPLLETCERAVDAGLRCCAKVSIGKAEQPIGQACD